MDPPYSQGTGARGGSLNFPFHRSFRCSSYKRSKSGAKDRLFVDFSVLDVIESLDAIIVLLKNPVSRIPKAATSSRVLTEIYSTRENQRQMAEVGTARMWEMAA